MTQNWLCFVSYRLLLSFDLDVLTFDDIGFFAAADPIARLPLIISISIATTILPASSEAFKLKDIGMLQKYVSEAYKFSLLFVVPMCVGLALFAEPTLRVLYFKNPAYVAGAMALAILSIGMTFYSIFAISTSIVQGIGNPRIPMYILVGGAVVTGVLNWIMVPTLGIAGGDLLLVADIAEIKNAGLSPMVVMIVIKE